MTAKKLTLKLLATVYNQPHPDHPDDPNRLVERSEGEVFEANSQEEYDRLIAIGAALDPDEAQKQEKERLDSRLAALDAEIAQVQERKDAIQAEAAAAPASNDPADLKGQALDDALVAAGLSTDGKADEKRARLAEHLQSQG